MPWSCQDTFVEAEPGAVLLQVDLLLQTVAAATHPIVCICVCICEYIYWWNNDGWLYNERQYLGVARSVLRVSVFKWKNWKTETLETTCFTPKWGLHLCFQPLLFIHAKMITCNLFFSYMYIQIYRYVCISLCIHICI